MHVNLSILFLAISCAFLWVEVFHLGSRKPFNCVKCMCGWFALAFACCDYGWGGILYAPMGVFVGAMYSGIKMRYL
jgi:hypothetical protein